MCVNQTLATLAIGCLLEVQPRGFNVMVFQSLIYEGDVISFHGATYVMCVYRTGMYRGRGCSCAILRRCRLLSLGRVNTAIPRSSSPTQNAHNAERS
jgi:hypothetical protein